MTYDWKSSYSKIQRKLSASKKAKEKNNWSRESGAGFIAEDIKGLALHEKKILFSFSWGSQLIPVKELNLRETEEALKYVLEKLEPKYVGEKA